MCNKFHWASYMSWALGVITYVMGNVLLEALAITGLSHIKRDGRCALRWQTLQTYYKVNHNKYQLHKLTLSTLKPGGQPPQSHGQMHASQRYS